jgi:hypothetical protein
MADIIDGINDKTAWWLLNGLRDVSSVNVALDALNKALTLWLGTEDWQKKRVQVEPPKEGEILPQYKIIGGDPVADLSTKLQGVEADEEYEADAAMTVLGDLLREQQRLTRAKIDAETRLQAEQISGGEGISEVSKQLKHIDSQLEALASRISKARVVDRAAFANVDEKNAAFPGGIDLNTANGMQWKVSRDGRGVEMNIDPAMIARIRREGIDSLSPVILRMTPVASIWPLMGLQAPA